MYQSHVKGELEKVGVKEHVIQLKLGKMRYYSGGNGFPLIFVHGFGGNASVTWKDQLLEFAKRYRVYAPDLFWFGESVPKDREKIQTPLAQATAIVALMKRHGLEKAHVVGVSFGGYVSTMLALRFPKKVAHLVLVDAAGMQPTAKEQAIMQKNFAYAKGDVPRLLMPDDTKQLKLFFDKVFYKPPPIPGFVMKEILEKDFWAHKKHKTRIARYLRKNFVGVSQFKQIKAPTLVAWGRHDPLLLPTMGQRVAQSIPGARIVFFEKSGHLPMREEASKFNKALHSFFPNR